MPQIIVLADGSIDQHDAPVMFRERVNASDFESRHFASQLLERLGWAVGDAQEVESVQGVEAGREVGPGREVEAGREVGPGREVETGQQVEPGQRIETEQEQAEPRPATV